jgi:hypothetical protein
MARAARCLLLAFLLAGCDSSSPKPAPLLEELDSTEVDAELDEAHELDTEIEQDVLDLDDGDAEPDGEELDDAESSDELEEQFEDELSDVLDLEDAESELEEQETELEEDELEDPCASCEALSVSLDFGALNASFEQAFFGLETEDQVTWSLYVELYRGGADGCPSQESPTPDYTLIISNWPLDATELSEEDGLSATLLDFSGDLLGGQLFVKADQISVRRVGACASCVNWPTPEAADGHIVVELDAQFPGGSVNGLLRASHCDSLDWP